MNAQLTPEINRGFVPFPAPKKFSGFNPAVLIQNVEHKTPKALYPMRCRGWGEKKSDGQKVRLLLIASNDLPSNTPHITRKRPTKSDLKQNRKYASKKSILKHKGTIYRINSGKKKNKGVYTLIVRRMIDQLTICLDNYGRVYAVRLDFHQKYYRGDNKLMSRFICNFRKAMLKEYGFNDFGYQWTRELETSKACHYHMVLFFNGYKIKSHWKIRTIARAVWERIKTGNTVPYWKPKRYGKIAHDIRKNDIDALLDAVEHFSYLAKARGKSYRDQQAKDYSTSRLVRGFKL